MSWSTIQNIPFLQQHLIKGSFTLQRTFKENETIRPRMFEHSYGTEAPTKPCCCENCGVRCILGRVRTEGLESFHSPSFIKNLTSPSLPSQFIEKMFRPFQLLRRLHSAGVTYLAGFLSIFLKQWLLDPSDFLTAPSAKATISFSSSYNFL